jgi:Rrf2 family protein
MAMKLSEGVEHAIHSVALLAGLKSDRVLAAAALAEFHGVSPSYLLKHLQALSAAGMLSTVPGPNGGYRLARSADKITLLDIVLAVEGTQPAFRCTEIRQRGPNQLGGTPASLCEINAAMLKAERAYRAELAKVRIADILADLAAKDSDGRVEARRCAFIELRERRQAAP